MQRRQLIQTMLGALTLLPTSKAFADLVAAPTPKSVTPILNSNERSLLTELTGTIIPETGTPGASQAGVPEFIEHLLNAWYEPADRNRFKSGMEALTGRCQSQLDKNFSELPEAERVALLTMVEADEPDTEPGKFISWMKELTVLGYYTSEIGATQELNYLPVPGPYRGCVDFSEVGRTWAL